MQTINTQTVTIDIRKRSLSTNFVEKENTQNYIPQFVQGDTNILEAVIKDGGVNADLSNVGKIVGNFKRKDGLKVSRSATKSGNTVTYTLGNEEMTKSGLGELELQFYNADDTERISTLRFKVNVMEEIGVGLEGEDGPTLVQELVFNGQYAKQAADSAITNWLEPVASYSAVTSISNPKHGDTVQTNDTGYVYRYENGSWKNTQQYGATALANVNAQLAEKVEQAKVQNFNLMSQSPKPTKSGVTSNSPKLAIKTGTDAFMVIQNMGKGYVAHTLDSNGGTTEVSHGVNWELLRLKKTQHVSDAYLAYSTFQNVVGTLTESSPGTKTADIIDTNLTDYNSVKAEPSSHKSSKAGDVGLSLYHIASSSAPSSVDFIVKTGRARKANAMLYGNTSGSSDVDILVNDQVVVKGINTKAFRSYGDSPGRNLIGIVEFDIPVLTTQTPRDIKITLRNNSLTDRLYFLGINFVKVKDYKGEYVDFYKILPNVLKWIDASGASDYAIREKGGLWCGSYHGGETRESGTIPWRLPTSTFIRSSADIGLSNFADIPISDWCVLDNLTISQRTNLINKAKMLSNWNFDVDGTFNMSFGLYDNTINIDLMYTSLTCTHVDFLYITYPKTFQVTSGIGNEFDIVEGKVTQRSASRGAELTVRFTKFNDFLSDKRVTVNSNSSYNKLYYSPISQISGGVVVPNLSFEKSLDFHVD